MNIKQIEVKEVLKPIRREQLETLSKQDLIALFLGEQDLREQAEAWARAMQDESYRVGELYIKIRNRMFEPKTEKSPKPAGKPRKKPKKAESHQLKPSERYPEAKIIEQEITIEPAPPCGACGQELEDSGMTETTEVLSVIPKQYIIKRQHYHKYRCPHCHGEIKTAPGLPRIKPGSSYDDIMMIDVAVSKYADLIPVERYATMAKRSGLPGLPAQSLIELTHYLADFVTPIYDLIKEEILAEKLVLHADETTHRMLEGDPKSSWYLWGFATDRSCYFECHDTRSGDVASEILLDARCHFLMSDVYSGYHKAVGVCNKVRREHGLSALENIYCNAHARRKFKELGDNEVGLYFVEQYKLIYKIEKESKDLSIEERQLGREGLRPIFKAMLSSAKEELERVSAKSQDAQALNYFIKNFAGLTKFLDDARLPIDNNHQERLLRNPVIGRKTWYGTHSKRGAVTAAKLFTVIESCKLNQLNPRLYLEQLTKDMHHKKPPKTPKQMADEIESTPKMG